MAACGTPTCLGGSIDVRFNARGWAVPRLLLGAVACCCTASSPAADIEPAAAPPKSTRPLHQEIDAIVAESAVGPSAARCGDADFVRRVHLDLAGVIPTAAAVREFLTDPAGDKRARLIDHLLADHGFARHLMFVLDAMLLERESPPDDLGNAWREYLFTALLDDKPLDALARDLLVSDGGDAGTRPAAAFLLVRDAEPVQLTRAIGRLYFGRDLQCAQCHDHPLNDDISQAEHQGLYAFVARTGIFKGKDNVPFVSEKADGEVDYQSVFTKQGEKGVWPRLPGGVTLVDEPRPEPATAYETEPSKTSRGVPKFSRRAALAGRLADDDGFRRNLANRIWAIFFGRGLVHPLDGIGAGNPPTHPRLLALLADALRDHGFHLRPIVRGILLSETYQRSIEPPRPDDVYIGLIGALITRLETARPSLVASRDALGRAAADAEGRRGAAAAATHAVHLERLRLLATRDAASKAAAEADAATAKAAAELATARRVSESMSAAAAQAAVAASSVPGDAALEKLAATMAADGAKKAAVTEACTRAHAEKQAASAAAAATLAAARAAAAVETARLGVDALAAAERDAVAARSAALDAGHELRRLDDRLQLARDLVAHAAVRGADPSAAAVMWDSIVERWSYAGQVAALRALSPEQLALSVQQATGVLAVRHASAVAAVDKSQPEPLAKASEEERSELRAMQVEMRMVKDASGMLRSTATLFGDTISSGFQASVNQALYFGNAPDIQGQLAPSGATLVAVLASMSDATAVADEAYVAVLARPPAATERDDVAAFLAARTADRPQAVAEFVWALVSSNEFRFNH